MWMNLRIPPSLDRTSVVVSRNFPDLIIQTYLHIDEVELDEIDD